MERVLVTGLSVQVGSCMGRQMGFVYVHGPVAGQGWVREQVQAAKTSRKLNVGVDWSERTAQDGGWVLCSG